MALDPALKEKLAQLAPEQRYRYYARRIATKYGIDPDVYEAQVQAESAWNPAAKSEQDARGLAQVLPATAAQYGVTPEQLNDPVIALDTGAKHLRTLLDKYQGDLPTAVLAYHQGEGNVDAGTIGPKGKAYQQKVLGLAEQFKAAAPKVQQAAVPAPATADTATPDAAPASDMEQPFVRPEDMSNTAPAAAAPAASTTPTSFLKQAGSGLAEGAANAVDLAGTVLGLTGPIKFPTVSDKVAAFLAGPPQTETERFARAGARGVGATVATGGTSLPAVALGAASGLGAEAGGDVSKKYLGTRTPGEIVGSLAPVAITSGARAWSARAARQAAEAEAVRQVEAKLSTQTPLERAATARDVLRGHTKDIRSFNSSAWDDFLGKYGQVGVPLDNLKNVTAQGIVNDAMAAGLSRDAAVAKADKIMSLVAPNGTPVDALPFAQAKELRSELGSLTERASRGATKYRAGQLYGELSKTMEAALPSDAARAEWGSVNAITKQEVELLRNTFVKRAIDARPQGQATADKYMVGVLEGGFTPARQVEVRALMKAGGDELKPVLGDALLRNTIRNNVVGTGENATIDWKGVAQALRDPQQLRDLSTTLFGAREQQTIIRLAEEAGNADPRSVLQLVGRVALDLTGGAAIGAVTGRPAAGEAWLGYRALSALRDPANRALLKRAGRTIADSIKGREILRALLVRPGEFVTPQATAPVGPGPSAPATTVAPSAPGMP